MTHITANPSTHAQLHGEHLSKIVDIVHRWAEVATKPRERLKFMAEAVAEHESNGNCVVALIGLFWDGLEAELLATFQQAQAAGELGKEKSAEEVALCVLAAMQSMVVMGSIDPSSKTMAAIANETIAQI
jgi:pheromone shutdown protein TraB